MDMTAKVTLMHTQATPESLVAIESVNQNTWNDYQFTIHGIHVRAREFSGGMLALSCVYNPQLIGLFKSWRKEGGGRYNPKYKSWEYWQPFAKTVLQRLHELHCILVK